jgi:hypothetical protein
LTAIRGSLLAEKPKPAVAMLTTGDLGAGVRLGAPTSNPLEEDRRAATIISAEARRPSSASVNDLGLHYFTRRRSLWTSSRSTKSQRAE